MKLKLLFLIFYVQEVFHIRSGLKTRRQAQKNISRLKLQFEETSFKAKIILFQSQ